ncbi:hypothetical protein PGT21_035988 [Puccinia graminis f. sp. tritici]|nr:hypothetical protein PGT21_035988 [Puccinia graminis f. sp. tritici]
MLHDWQKMKEEMEFEKEGGMADRAEVDGALEEAVLDMALDNGEDVDDDEISGSEDGDVDSDVEQNFTNDGVDVDNSQRAQGDDDGEVVVEAAHEAMDRVVSN